MVSSRLRSMALDLGREERLVSEGAGAANGVRQEVITLSALGRHNMLIQSFCWVGFTVNGVK